MKAVVQTYKTGQLEVVETPPPQIRPGWLLVHNSHSLISAGTEKTKITTAQKSLLGKALARPDLVKKVIAKARTEGLWKTWQATSERLEQSIPLGYSCAGQVIATSDNVDGLSVGDWVACGGSTANHAEVVCVPKNLAVPIPEGLNTDAASFATLGAIAMQGLRQADLSLGEKVAVIGLGLIGLLTVQLARAAGCRVIGIDVDPSKLPLALQFGCTDALLARDEGLEERVLLFTDGYGVDATIIAAGTSSNAPIECAGEITREKGRVVVVGAARMDVPREPYYHKEIDLRMSRSYGPGRYDPEYEEHGRDYPFGYVRFTERRNMAAFLDLLQNGSVKLDHMMTHRFSIDDAARAYDLLDAPKEFYLGILLEYPRHRNAVPRRVELDAQPQRNGRIVVGVIGAGSYACKFLLPAIQKHPLLKPGGVCTVSGVSAERVARKFGFAAAESDPDAVITSSDAVLIATRHNDHAELVIRAMRQRRPVFVEKPLAITGEQLDKIEEFLDSPLAEDASASQRTPPTRSLMVGFNRRFAPATQLVLEHFRGRKGAKCILIRINAGAISKDHWIHDSKVGGGRLIGEGCHFVDLAVALTGSRIKRVNAAAVAQAPAEPRLWDNFTINLSFEDNSLATIFYTSIGGSSLHKEEIQVFSGGKAAIIDDFRSVKLWSDGGSKTKRWWQQDKGQSAQMNAWAEGLMTGHSPISLVQIINVHRACFAAIESLHIGAVVELA